MCEPGITPRILLISIHISARGATKVTYSRAIETRIITEKIGPAIIGTHLTGADIKGERNING